MQYLLLSTKSYLHPEEDTMMVRVCVKPKVSQSVWNISKLGNRILQSWRLYRTAMQEPKVVISR